MLEVGGEAYGTRDRYVRNQATGEIYLVDDETLRPLKYARTRLPDRSLSSLEPEKVSSAIIEGSGTRLEVSHVNAQDKANEGWARAGADAALDPEVKTWMEQLFKVKGTSYAEPSEVPANLEYRFKVALSNGKDPAQTLEFSQAGAEGDWFVESEHTRGLVKLLRGPTASLYDDVEGIISGG